MIDGGETGGGSGVGGGVGDGGAGDDGGVFTLPTIPVQPDRNNVSKAKSVRRWEVIAQKGRGFGSRGRGCLIKKKQIILNFVWRAEWIVYRKPARGNQIHCKFIEIYREDLWKYPS